MTRRDWLSPATVALLALAATITSLSHDFTFDDRFVILSNAHVHEVKQIWRLFGQTYWPKELGGDGYRPLVMSLFTVQWAVGGGAPWLFHLGNVLLAVGAALSVQWCAAAMLPRIPAWVAAALFAVHPVHVEATGNIVGQSELIVAICLCLAVGIFVRARREGALPPRYACAIIGLYVAALLSKEHAVVLPALLAAAEWTFVRDVPWRTRVRQLRLFALLLVAVSLAYLLVLGLIHQDLTGFVPYTVFLYLHMSTLDRVATMMGVIPRVAQLLIFPTHLSGDYSPSDVAVAHGFDVAQLPGVFLCFGVAALAVLLRKREAVASFGLCWLVIAFLPVSNLLVPTGFLVAERTLFLPSVGVVLVAGALVQRVRTRARVRESGAMAAAVGVLITLGLARSIDRQRVWANNDVFFDALVQDAPNSYRAHFLRGRQIGTKGRFRETQAEYRTAMRLFPYDATMMLTIAGDYYRGGECPFAIALLRWSYAVEPRVSEGRAEYVDCLARENMWTESRTEALTALSVVPPRRVRRLRLAVARADSALGRSHPQ
jgi:4-amino-4-deoxy-L-arabinose transferase-like glycosyltransferase